MAQGAGEVSVQVVRSGRGQVRVVGRVSLPRQGVVLAAHVGGRHPLLLLPPIAKPDPDHLLLEAKLLGQHGYFLIIRSEYFVMAYNYYVFGRKRRGFQAYFSSGILSKIFTPACAEGFGLLRKCCSNVCLMDTSMLVRFFRFRPWAAILSMLAQVPVVLSASCSHFCNKGFSLHMFLKLSCRASNLQIVVWEKTFPYKVPSASPTSAWVKPSLIRLCLNCFAKASRSSVKPKIGNCN